MTKVHILVIATRHDDIVSVHRTVDDLMKELANFVDANWAKEMNGALRPRDNNDAIDYYFEEMQDTESYSDYEADLPDLPQS